MKARKQSRNDVKEPDKVTVNINEQDVHQHPEPDAISQTGLFPVPKSDAGIDFHRDSLGRFTSGSVKKYSNAEELQNEVINYLIHCEELKKSPTMTGLAIALGFKSRNSLANYRSEPGYEFAFDIINYAKMRIEEYIEQKLIDSKSANVAGLIFNLKNNFNWVDRQEVKVDQRTMKLVGGFTLKQATDGKDS